MTTEGKPALVPKGVQMFDIDKLPVQPLLDTTVWLRALGWETESEQAALCRSFVQACMLNDRRLLIAAPSLAEMLRRDPGRKMPIRKSVVHVAFDRPAAEVLQKIAPWNEVPTDGDRRAMKLDALIIASAERHNASCVVTLDLKFGNAAPRRTVPIKLVSDYLLPVYDAIAKAREEQTKAAKP